MSRQKPSDEMMPGSGMMNILDCLHQRQVGGRTRVEDVFIREKWKNDRSLYKKVRKIFVHCKICGRRFY